MLVIISDLHLTDGTSGPTVDPGAFSIFAERLRDLAGRASWRADGCYRPLDRIDLVLLGDVLDQVRSNHWFEANVRPWDNTQSAQLSDAVGNITDNILSHNSHSLAILRSLAADGAVSVPPADQAGRPVYSNEAQSVPVRIHYMVGNHDWFLHLRGPSYDLLRQKVAHHMGLANSHNEPFSHDPTESDELLDTMRRHRVIARHGDIFDPLNFAEDRDCSSLGDAIVIELVNRFAYEIQRDFGDDIPAAVINGLREIDSIRPLVFVPVWIEGLLERTCPSPAVRKIVKRTWDGLADEFLALQMVRDRDSWSPFDLVDGLEQALKFSKRLSLGWASKIATWLHSLRGAGEQSYYTHALGEQDFRNRRARHIVYGHTHSSETVPLDASYADGYVLNQMYFNSGTWRRVYRPTQWASSEHEFVASDMMSMLAFYQGDERSGRPFETWTGSLGAAPADSQNRRVDPAQQPTISAQHSPPAAAPAAVHAPHFGRPSSNPRVAPVRRI